MAAEYVDLQVKINLICKQESITVRCVPPTFLIPGIPLHRLLRTETPQTEIPWKGQKPPWTETPRAEGIWDRQTGIDIIQTPPPNPVNRMTDRQM